MNACTLMAILALGSLLAPLAAEAQPPANVPRVGFVESGDPEPITAFRQGLCELGYVEGQDIIIEWRSWEGRPDRAPEFIAELVRLKVAVLVVGGSRLVPMAKKATTTIPIVMIAGGDVVGKELVASFARPGGNVTGLTVQHPELSGKTLELLKETIPHLSRIAILWEAPIEQATLREMEAAARALGLQLQILEVRGPTDFDGAFWAAVQGRAEALHIISSAMLGFHHARIADFAAKSRLPTIANIRSAAEDGLLMSYGPDIADLFRRAAAYVDKILKGTKPGDLPVERPMKFELVVNLKTAKALGLTIPPSILFQASEVIQ